MSLLGAPTSFGGRVFPRRVGLFAALFVAFLACTAVRLPFSTPLAAAVRFGAADALALVALVRWSRSRVDDVRILLAALIAACVAEQIAGIMSLFAGLSTLLNAGQIVLATWLVRRLAPGGFISVAQGWRFLAASAGAIATASGAVLLSMTALGVTRAAHLDAATYTIGKLLAFVVVAPLAMGLTREALAPVGRGPHWPEATALASVVVAVTAAALMQRDLSLLFAASPFVIWTTFRFRLPGAAVAILLMTVVVVALTGIEPGGGHVPDSTGLSILGFLALNVLTVVPIAAALGERDGLAQIAAERDAVNARINRGLNQALLGAELAERMVGMGHWAIHSPSGEQVWSRGAYELFGRDPALGPADLDELAGRYVVGDPARFASATRQALSRRQGFDIEYSIVRDDGEIRDVFATAQFVAHEDGTGVMVGVTRDRTAEKAEAAARVEVEASYRLLTQHAIDIIARVENSVIAFISPACEVVSGFPPQSFVGRPFSDFIHPDDQSEVETRIRELFASGAKRFAEPIEYRLRCADGSWRWVASNPNVVQQAGSDQRVSITVIRDITEAKLTAARLEASESRYRLLAETATDMISRFNLGGRIKFITPACERILGYQPEELVGVRTLDLTHPDDVAGVIATYTAYVAAGPDAAPIITRYRARHRDGRWVWLEGMPRVVFDPTTGKPIEMQDVVRDVTARHELEIELIAAREAAEAGAQAKADFLANMSHELRTPLNSIVGFSGLIAKAGELLPETRRRAELVSGASRSLVAIVNDILDMSRIESEGVSLDPEPVDLDALLVAALDLVREEAERKRVHLAVQILRPAELLQLDPVRVRQVVLNLLSNALKFTEIGGRVTLTLADEPGGAVRVSVRDTGVGVPPERLESIFGRFAQADMATSRRFGGTGLGLTICRSLVEAMGGRIGVQSTPGRGSTFWFTLPAQVVAAIEIAPPPASMREPTSIDAKPGDATLRVLLADDNEINRDLFRAMSAGRGLSIVEAADGVEAVARVREASFDVVLMDVQMPAMDGLEATRTIRALGLLDLPILALTANVLPAEITRCLEAGMNDHIAKPYTIEAVVTAIRRWATPVAPPLDGLREAIGGDMLDTFLRRLAEQLQAVSELFGSPGFTTEELARGTHRICGLAGTLGLEGLARDYGELDAAFASAEIDAALVERAREATTAGLNEIAALRAA